MSTNPLKFIVHITAVLSATLLGAQTNLDVNCDVPSTYFVGEYVIADHVATVGPVNGSSNFESGTYMVTANGTTRSFQIGLLPLFVQNDFTVELNLNCGTIQMNDIDTNLSCSTNPLIFGSTIEANSSTYDLNDDGTFVINYIEDPLGSCGGPYVSSFTMTKVCSPAENITFSNITASSIDMNWTDPNDTQNSNLSYSIEYGLQGFSLGNGQTITEISGDTFTIDNLQVQTMYDFYIWTQCSASNSSEVLGPFSHGTFTNPVFEVAANGITCTCADANIGDSGTVTISGQQITFTKRTRSQLLDLIENDINDPEIALTCTTAIEDMSHLFENETSFNQDISTWDVSNVTDMSYMFYVDFNVDPPYSSFNADLSVWDVSNVTDMSHMFECARVFNADIGVWDVSNVTDMSYMFSRAVDFNQDISMWNVSNVTNMSYMFKMAMAIYWFNNEFNAPLNNWDVSNVINMSHMFEDCNRFNQQLDNWDVSNVSDMSYMFYSTGDFNQNISMWNVSNVTNMSDMFGNAYDFNQPLNGWDVSNVVFMEAMFAHTQDFNQPLNNWDVSSVVDMQYMFLGSRSFNESLNDWDVSNVDHMGSMFLSSVYNQPLNDWDVSNVTRMQGMFASESQFNQPIGDWDVSNVTLMTAMFSNSPFNQDISGWCVEQFPIEPGSFSFACPLLEEYKPNWGEPCTLSLSDNELEFFKMYPNPVKDKIYIEIKESFDVVNIEILDISGKIIYAQHVDAMTTEIDLEFLNSGLYFLKISNVRSFQLERFVKE